MISLKLTYYCIFHLQFFISNLGEIIIQSILPFILPKFLICAFLNSLLLIMIVILYLIQIGLLLKLCKPINQSLQLSFLAIKIYNSKASKIVLLHTFIVIEFIFPSIIYIGNEKFNKAYFLIYKFFKIIFDEMPKENY